MDTENSQNDARIGEQFQCSCIPKISDAEAYSKDRKYVLGEEFCQESAAIDQKARLHAQIILAQIRSVSILGKRRISKNIEHNKNAHVKRRIIKPTKSDSKLISEKIEPPLQPSLEPPFGSPLEPPFESKRTLPKRKIKKPRRYIQPESDSEDETSTPSSDEEESMVEEAVEQDDCNDSDWDPKHRRKVRKSRKKRVSKEIKA